MKRHTFMISVRLTIAVDDPHYLGPVILAQGRVIGLPNTNPGDAGYPKPVRIKFYNLLPTGSGGNLFLPVDESIPGAGYGPVQDGNGGAIKYTQNRATIHLHGNNTIWISDGNVHQWISPAGENTPYPKGVSVGNVPDMMDESGTAVDCDAPGSGCMTFYYTNAQSARLQFYHDHAFGITRLNVYAGEAAGYVIERAVDSGTFSLLATVGADFTSYLDQSALTSGSICSYRVAAANGAVMSAYATSDSVEILTSTPLPTAPVIQTATAARQGNRERVTLTWADVTDETAYTIQWRTDDFVTVSGSGSVGADVTTFTTGNIARQVWSFRVGATNATETAWSTSVSVPAAQ